MICGIDPVWGGEIAWLDSDHSQIHDAEEVERLEQAYRDTGSEPDGFTRSGFVKRWEFVTACFTEQGCKDYLDANGHNLRNPRIYVHSGYRNAEWIKLREWLTAVPAPAESHPDDVAVDNFAAAMKAKMAKQRAKGYGGWDDPSDCAADFLRERLAHHIIKGDPVDVGNFAMMLFNRGESTAPVCTCPSGDGSLRWPCPSHPPAEAKPAEPVVTVLRIDRSERLDPITVFLEDMGNGRGRMTVCCYAEAWTAYWGAMGTTLREFIASADAEYVAGNMVSGLASVSKSKRDYVTRIAGAVIAALRGEGA
jgi:hypothetical protein